jgi:hypothetical protein
MLCAMPPRPLPSLALLLAVALVPATVHGQSAQVAPADAGPILKTGTQLATRLLSPAGPLTSCCWTL